MKTKKQPIDYTLLKPITLDEAKQLKYRDELYLRDMGKLSKCRVNGQVKTWKRSPKKVQVPLKAGLYEFGYLTENNLERFSLESRPYQRLENVRVCPATGLEEMLYSYTRDFVNSDSQLKEDRFIRSCLDDIGETLLLEHDPGYTLYELLPNLMNEFAPEGYYYGCHESDGEWGFWPMIGEDE